MSTVFIKRDPLRFLCSKGNEITLSDYLTGRVELADTAPPSSGWLACELDERFYKEVYEAAIKEQLLPNVTIAPGSTYESRLKQITARQEILQGHYIVCTDDLMFYCTRGNDVTGIDNVLRGETKPGWFTNSMQAKLACEIVQELCPSHGKTKWVAMQYDAFLACLREALGVPLAVEEHKCNGCRGCQSTCDAAY